MLSPINEFVFESNNRLRNLPLEKRKKIIDRVIDNLNNIDFFTPLHEMCDDDDYDDDFGLILESRAGVDDEHEKRIKSLQLFYSGHPEIQSDDDDYEEIVQKEKNAISRCGRTDLHDAVLMNDLDMIRSILTEGNVDLNSKDNNGRTALQVAFLEENMTVIALFKELGKS